MRLLPVWLVMLWLFPLATHAAEILDSTISLESGRYTIEVNAHIDAPLVTVQGVITDYNNLSTVNSSIKESRILLTYTPNRHRVHTVIRVCILFFCKSVRQVQDVIQHGNHRVEAVMLPEFSDFKSGDARWDLSRLENGTHLYFISMLEPAFWVPPVIGPWLIQRRINHEIIESARYMESKGLAGLSVGE